MTTIAPTAPRRGVRRRQAGPSLELPLLWVGVLRLAERRPERFTMVVFLRELSVRLPSAVASALLKAGVQQLRLARLSVSELPDSGTPAELLAAADIDATHMHRPPLRIDE